MAYYYSQAEAANKFLESLVRDIKSGKINVHELRNVKELVTVYDQLKHKHPVDNPGGFSV